MINFKVGDRVVITKSVYMTEKTVGAKGTIVAIDKDGDELVKLDKEIGSYSYAHTHSYMSDKEDLIVIDHSSEYEIELIEENNIKNISRDDSGNLVANINGKDLELLIKRNSNRNN